MKRLSYFLSCLLLMGCAGIQRDCSSCMASQTGADWIVLQYRFDGQPINCWKLRNVGISNEKHTDGIFWLDPNGHLVHISGWYNRVQVAGGDYAGAGKAIGIDEKACTNGKYVSED